MARSSTAVTDELVGVFEWMDKIHDFIRDALDIQNSDIPTHELVYMATYALAWNAGQLLAILEGRGRRRLLRRALDGAISDGLKAALETLEKE